MKIWEITQEELLLFFKKQKWQRITRKIGNYTYFYFFYILEKDNNTYILNTKTLKCASIKSINHRIIPLILDLDKNAFTHKNKTIFVTHKEYIFINNWILDSRFNHTIISTKYENHPTILDTLDYYIATSDFQGIHLFKIINFLNPGLKIAEFHYFYKNTDNEKAGLFIDDELNCFSPVEYFNPYNKKFFIDVNRLKEEDKSARQEFLNSDSYEHYSMINDGYDGEAEAYDDID